MTRSRFSKQGLAILGSLTAALAAGGILGCMDAYELEITGELNFNDKLRADAGALSANQQFGPPWVERDGKAYYSDGGPNFNELVSEIFHSRIDTDRRAFSRAGCAQLLQKTR